MRDNPKLRGKPVIVGGKASSRGVVSTASYEARKYGVHSAMPMSQAHKLCPDGYYVQGQYENIERFQMKSCRFFVVILKRLSLCP